MVVSQDPEAHREMLLAFTGAEESAGTNKAYSIALPRGRITMMTPNRFDALYGVAMRGDGVSAVISQRLREAEPA